ncbi:MAG: hypothetical protein WDN04_07525 [Rhodospirillales bacterium]
MDDRLLLALDLRDITLFCQDWGGLIGLRLVAALPERFANVVVSNTGLPVGGSVPEAFAMWLQYSQTVPVLPIGALIDPRQRARPQRGGNRRLRCAVP